MFEVPIRNSKCVEIIKFHSKAQMIKYCQKSLNSYCFSSLATTFAIIKQTKAVNAILMRIEESLKSEVGNSIDVANAILKNKKIFKGEQRVYYSLVNIKIWALLIF